MLILAGAAAHAGLLPARASAQGDAANWPSGTVTIVSPFTPGGMSDVLGRALGEKLSLVFGRNFIVENRAGAGGTLGATSVARAAPDGHTLLVGHIGILAVNPSLYTNLQYQPLTSFAFVAPLALVPNVLVINPKVPVHNVAELIAHAKAGTAEFLLGRHRGCGAYRNGRVQCCNRHQNGPRAGFEASSWYGIGAPASTSDAIVQRLYSEIRKAMASPEIARRLNNEGAEHWVVSLEEFRNYVAVEIQRWKSVIEAANIRVE